MPDHFKHKLRAAADYRAERIDAEIDRLQRRIEWAEQRGDRQAGERLERRLLELLGAADADLTPGKAVGRFDGYRLLSR